MTKAWMLACAGALALTACDETRDGPAPTSEAAAEAAGDKTLAAGLGDTAKFAAAIKAAGSRAHLPGRPLTPCSRRATPRSTNCPPARSTR